MRCIMNDSHLLSRSIFQEDVSVTPMAQGSVKGWSQTILPPPSVTHTGETHTDKYQLSLGMLIGRLVYVDMNI